MSGTTVTTIAQSGGQFGNFSTTVAINSAGTVAFQGPLVGGGLGVFASNGGPITTISQSSIEPDSPTINAAGLVAFRSSSAINVGNGGPLTTIADTSGPYSSFDSFNVYPGNDFETPGITGSGTVVFAALLTAGGTGLFTGPDPSSDRVIASGDPLFGSTLTNIYYFGGVSDNGNVAFGYTLTDGVTGVAVAELVPEPDGLTLVACTMIILGASFRRRKPNRAPAPQIKFG